MVTDAAAVSGGETDDLDGLDMDRKPEWWHRHSYKVQVENADLKSRRFRLSATAVCLAFTSRGPTLADGWLADWEVRFSKTEYAYGRMGFTTAQLRRAFGLDAEPAELDGFERRQCDRYAADDFVQGRFIRAGAYANIPGPGTGHDCDPSVSFYLDETVTKAVGDFLDALSDD